MKEYGPGIIGLSFALILIGVLIGLMISENECDYCHKAIHFKDSVVEIRDEKHIYSGTYHFECYEKMMEGRDE